MKRVAVAWSGGKDCAWALRYISPTHLITTYDQSSGRVPIHDVPLARIQEQSDALGLPLVTVPLPPNCDNAAYIHRFKAAVTGFDSVVFGDLFLEDIRRFREQSFPELQLLFPLWHRNTLDLAYEMIDGGLEATVTAAGEQRLIGRKFNRQLLQDLPPHADPCGENGEFHTLVEPRCLESFR